LFRILQQLERATLFTEADLLDRLLEFSKQQDLPKVTTILETRSALIGDAQLGASGELHSPAPGDLAFIQYSSGSTSDPKGVCLTHRNLCTNVRAIVEATHWMKDDVSLSWMPLTHDMGLIGYHLSVMAAGMNHAVMDTSLFVRRPLLWMGKVNELRATQLCSPNLRPLLSHALTAAGRVGQRIAMDLLRIVPGEESATRGPATRGVVELGETEPVPRQRVEVWRLNLAAIAAGIGISHVIGQDEDDIWRSGE
jgi:acyl-coenzyme A synthetase/AMP-(fatty) acid ligase